MFWTWNNSNSSDFLQSLYIFLSLVLFNHSFFLFLNGYRLFVLTFSFDTFSSPNLPLSNFWHFLLKLNFFARIFSVGWGYRVAAVHAETWQQGCEMAMKLSAQKRRKWRDNVTMSCIDAVCNRISHKATSRSFLIFALPRWRNNDWTCEWKAFAQDPFACGTPQRHILGCT